MSHSRQIEIEDTQLKIWKQSLKRLSRSHTRTHQSKQIDTVNQELVSGSIFVSIPSYRDPECPKTILDVFQKASYPHRVFVGVCQQNEVQDIDCMSLWRNNQSLRRDCKSEDDEEEEVQKFYSNNIRILRLHATQARGPVYARALIEQQLYRNEMYYMTIDSHTQFIDGWDVEAIHQLMLCPSIKPVLTCYPPDYDIKTRQQPIQQPSTFLKFRDFHPRLGLSQQDPVRFHSEPSIPQPSLFWGAGFSFTLGSVIDEVPFDINLQYIFLGEEITMAARLYTHGWDTFAPVRNIVYHYTPRKTSTGADRPLFWENFYVKNGTCKASPNERTERKILETQNNNRMRVLLTRNGEEKIAPPYGLGTARSLTQFEDFIGLDFTNKLHRKHSKLGLTKDAGEEERYCKYGN